MDAQTITALGRFGARDNTATALWLEIDQDNLHTKFSALSVDFTAASSNPLGSSRAAHTGIKEGYPLKSYVTAISLCSVKTLADGCRHAAYHNKH